MDPSQRRLIRRRVRINVELTEQNVELSSLSIFSAFVIGGDIKEERQLIHINIAAVWFLLNAIQGIECSVMDRAAQR